MERNVVAAGEPVAKDSLLGAVGGEGVPGGGVDVVGPGGGGRGGELREVVGGADVDGG